MYLLGIDVGTSGVKAMLVASTGEVKAHSTHSYPLSSPQNGWFEQNPDDWWEATVLSVREVLQAAAVPPAEVRGIGLSGQYHGLVILGDGGKVLRPSIIWNDQRTAAQSARIQEKAGADRLSRICATRGAPYFTACKLEWVKEHEPRIYDQVRTLMLPKDYIRYRLTGERCTDVTDASGTLFLDVAKRKWSEEMARILEVDPAWLPRVVESAAVSGTVCAGAAELTGLHPGTPVAGGAGDQAAAAVGIGVVAEGILTLSVGTSGVIYGAADRLVTDAEGRFDTFCHAVPGTWCVLACINSATASYQWYQDRLAEAEKLEAQKSGRTVYDVLEGEAAGVPAGSDRLIFLPYLAGERHPHTDTAARGVFFGLHSGHTRAHLVRAILEGVAFSFRDCLEAMKHNRIRVEEIRATGGGTQSALWTRILASALGQPVVTMGALAGGASFGAAILGGVCAGEFAGVPEACAALVHPGPCVEPSRDDQGEYDGYFRVFQSLYPALKEPYRRLAEL
jgi:xylulokinase